MGILGSTYAAKPDKIIITTKNDPSKDGTYEKVEESHYVDDKYDNHTLGCSNPGSKGCVWSKDPWSFPRQQLIEAQILENVKADILSGTISTDDGVTTNWEAQSVNNFTYTITIPQN